MSGARFHLIRWLACWLGLVALACADEPPAIVDCHVHLWDIARPAGLGWIKKDDKTLYRSLSHCPAVRSRANGKPIPCKRELFVAIHTHHHRHHHHE